MWHLLPGGRLLLTPGAAQERPRLGEGTRELKRQFRLRSRPHRRAARIPNGNKGAHGPSRARDVRFRDSPDVPLVGPATTEMQMDSHDPALIAHPGTAAPGSAGRPAALRSFSVLARRIRRAWAELRRRARARAELLSLDDHALRDLGLDRSTVGWYLANPMHRTGAD